VTEQLLVPFDGTGSGTGELSWGQREIWLLMTEQHSSLPISGVLALPAGTTLASLTGAVAQVMGRHPALRTRISFDEGRPRQVAAADGAIGVRVEPAGGADPDRVAADVCADFVDTEFDYAAEWPVRWAVVTADGAPAYLVWAVCHLAADGSATGVIIDELAARLGAEPGPITFVVDRNGVYVPVTPLTVTPAATAARVSELGPVTGVPPLEQAAAQATSRRSVAALAHWEKVLRAVPARRFTEPAEPRQPRYWQLCYDSPATDLAIRVIARRTGTSTSTVLLAAYAVTMARLTQANPAVVQVVVSNRFRPGFASSVSPVSQAGLCAIDVAGITVDEAVARAFRTAMTAYKLAYYDPLARDELIAAISAERGAEVDVGCSVNDRRIVTAQDDGRPDPGAEAITAALRRSELLWGFRRDRPTGRCFLLVNDVPGTTYFELIADTSYLPPDSMEACLRGIEAVAVAAALDPAAATGVAATGAAATGELAPA
jgi:Condensation domain